MQAVIAAMPQYYAIALQESLIALLFSASTMESTSLLRTA
jgi:hypothetical protein